MLTSGPLDSKTIPQNIAPNSVPTATSGYLVHLPSFNFYMGKDGVVVENTQHPAFWLDRVSAETLAQNVNGVVMDMRPSTIRAAFSGPLFGFTAYNQFIVYCVIPSKDRPGKTDKFPCDYRTAKVKVNPHDPQYWTDAATAEATAAAWGKSYGVGFVFTANDPFWFLDMDGSLVDGQWSPLALSLFQLLPGCAAEISGSMTGGHIFGKGRMPAHGCRNQALGLEFYHQGRFVALTGAGAVGNCLTDMTDVLPAFIAKYFPSDASTGTDRGWTEEHCAGAIAATLSDDELIRRALNSNSAAARFNGKASFADLWTANVEVLSKAYPAEARSYDASSADMALAQHLAWWTGGNSERIQALMLRPDNKLLREKYDREDYLIRTINSAVARQDGFYGDREQQPAAGAGATGEVPEGTVGPLSRELASSGFLSLEQQAVHFSGLVYIESMNKVLCPDGSLLKPEAFTGRYSGFKFRMDINNGGGAVTPDPWKAWRQNQICDHVRAYSTCFKPQLPTGAIVTRGSKRYANSYVKLNIERKAGDASPFLKHLAKVLPNERDAKILLSYMSACVQHQGVKFQWAPVLQGAEGNGKSLFPVAWSRQSEKSTLTGLKPRSLAANLTNG